MTLILSKSPFGMQPLAHRLTDRRPVLTREKMMGVAKRLLSFTSGDTAQIMVTHRAHVITRLANGQVLTCDDGDQLFIGVTSAFGGRSGYIGTDQLDESVLRALVVQCEEMARANTVVSEERVHIASYQPQVPDVLVPVALWHDDTILAMASTREAVIPELLGAVARENLNAAGFLGFLAKSEAIVTKDGIEVFCEQTDCELTVTARGNDGKSSGWGGQAARNWKKIRPDVVVAHAIDMAKRSKDPVALEPGRRTAILSSAAVIQLARYLSNQLSGDDSDNGETGFSKGRHGSKYGQKVFDSRVTLSTDPADPDGGYCPYFNTGNATPAMTFVENGVLKKLAYGVTGAMLTGRQYAQLPYSLRMSGGTTSIDDMIKQCPEGVYVNRFSGVDLVDRKTSLLTGVTRDGCFFVKDGKISKPVKNFRFLESPFFMFNKIQALGVPERAAFGYTPPGVQHDGFPSEWPRWPIIVPPMMVNDFNFSALADAV